MSEQEIDIYSEHNACHFREACRGEKDQIQALLNLTGADNTVEAVGMVKALMENNLPQENQTLPEPTKEVPQEALRGAGLQALQAIKSDVEGMAKLTPGDKLEAFGNMPEALDGWIKWLAEYQG